MCPASRNTTAYNQQYIINIVPNFLVNEVDKESFVSITVLCVLPSLASLFCFVDMILVWIGKIKLCVKFIGAISLFSPPVLSFALVGPNRVLDNPPLWLLTQV